MQDKNQFDKNSKRHGYWRGSTWTAYYIHGQLSGYCENFWSNGRYKEKEYYAS
jgi:hypothetical protein